MDGQGWTRFDDKPCLHMRLVAWAMRRSEKRERPLLSRWRRFAV